MSRFDSRRDALCGILAGEACVRPAILHDPPTARMAELLGYECGMIPGSDVALSVLGAPDIALITMDEFVGQVHRLTRATSTMPLIADGDHGYGNAVNVRRFIAELETVGLCGVTIEDTELPQPFGVEKGRLIPVEEAAAKLRAALAGRSDPRFAVIGRTNMTLAAGGLDEAVARLRAYEAAGVDALFVQGIKTRAELDRLSGSVSLPFVATKPPDELDDADYLASRRVRIGFPSGKKAMTAAIDAAHEMLWTQRPGARPLADKHADLIRLLTAAEDYERARRDFLKPPTA